jgi:CubicO group peptidase (beta-lactamase class C family)
MRFWSGSSSVVAAINVTLLACSSSSSPPAASSDAGVDASNGSDGSIVDAKASDDVASDASIVTPAETAAFARLIQLAKGHLSDANTPGASIAVVLHGKLAFAQGVGIANAKTKAPVTTSTLFRAASLSKMIVAATAMTLVDEGKLDLTFPITNYIPWFELQSGFDASTMTTSDLLSHSSGFPCDTIPFCDGTATSGPRKTFFVNNPQPLWAPPGTTWDYSNAGFDLAASVIEAAAGGNDGDYDTLAHDRIFVPTGMTTATFDAATEPADHALGYDLDDAENVMAIDDPSDLECPMLDPAGGINATATDFAHFAEMLLANGSTVLSSSSVAAMETSHIDERDFPTRGYGYALITQFSPYPNHRSVWHDGDLPGFLSLFWMIPDSDFAVVVLVNANGPDSPEYDIVGDALELFVSTVEDVPTSDAGPEPAYVGTYDDDYATLGKGVAISISTDDAGVPSLVMNAPNATDLTGASAPMSGTMEPIDEDQWLFPDNTTYGIFYPDDAGVPKYLSTRRGTATRQ